MKNQLEYLQIEGKVGLREVYIKPGGEIDHGEEVKAGCGEPTKKAPALTLFTRVLTIFWLSSCWLPAQTLIAGNTKWTNSQSGLG